MDSTLIALIAFWTGFFILHSILASNGVKQWFQGHFPVLHRRYRLLYNMLAMITIVPAMAIALFADSPSVWYWHGYIYLISAGLTLFAVVGFVGSTYYYDMAVFIGLVPDEESHTGTPNESFTLSPFHRWVRHPWYFFGIVLIWAQDMTVYWLASCILVTLYFWIGSWVEEKKLVAFYGESYKKYQTLVPALFPLPWKHLSAAEAAALQAGETQS